MLKKTITYTDYNGTERTEDFYFNLTETECVELETSINGGLSALINKIIQTNDHNELIQLWKKIIYLAYGEKSLDGKHFVKTKEVKDNFTYTEAYNKLFMELSRNAQAGTDFINGIIPQKAVQNATPQN